MAQLFKEGIIYKNEKVWKSLTEDYYLCFAYGEWSPATANTSLIYRTETNNVRQLLVHDDGDIEVGWDLASNLDKVIISKTFTPTEEIQFNRIFVKVGGPQRAKFRVEFAPFNTLKILSGLDDLSKISRISYNGALYDVSVNDTDEEAMSVVPVDNAPYLPSSGISIINDASGSLLIGAVMDNNYLLEKNVEAYIRLRGYTTQ